MPLLLLIVSKYYIYRNKGQTNSYFPLCLRDWRSSFWIKHHFHRRTVTKTLQTCCCSDHLSTSAPLHTSIICWFESNRRYDRWYKLEYDSISSCCQSQLCISSDSQNFIIPKHKWAVLCWPDKLMRRQKDEKIVSLNNKMTIKMNICDFVLYL